MSKPPVRESLMLEGPSGALEAVLEVPAEQEIIGAAVVCHPHPQHGGTLQNKVAHTLARVGNELGYASLRFNFRGVGASEGFYDQGVGEQDDARAAVEYACTRFPGEYLLAGFSFGSIVALEVARRDPPGQLVSIAPPVGRVTRSNDWVQPQCPWTIVQGDQDELVDADEVVRWVDSLEPGPHLIVMNGVDHFFHGQLVNLRKLLVDELGDQNARQAL